MSEQTRTYKWAGIAILIAVAIVSLYPPSEKLKAGIDLSGGTSLLFELDTTGLEGPELIDLSSRVMEILKARVDPGGLMNIEWRPIGNNRLEIRMPLPSREALARRDRYNEIRDEIQSRNLTRVDVELALSADPAQRQQMLDALIRGVPERESLLKLLVTAYDRKQERSADVDAGTRDMYELRMANLLATNLSVQPLVDILGMPDRKARSQEIEKLSASKTAYADLIGRMTEAYDAWAKNKAELEGPEDLKRRIRGAGVLEFRILAERDPGSPNLVNSFGNPQIANQEVSKYVDQLVRYGPRTQPGDAFRWFPVEDIQDFIRLDDEARFDEIKNEILYPIVEKYSGKYYVLAFDRDGYVMRSGARSTDRWQLRRAIADRDPMSGQNVVVFDLDGRGGQLFGRLTGENVQRQLCIFLDDTAISHANIVERITSRCQIKGGFTLERVRDLVRTLEAGALPARLKETPLAEKTIGPSIGNTNREKGLQAAYLGLAATAVFVLLYYGIAAGGVANLALALNLLFVLAAMALTESTFTLPGIAGVILTVGMAVDANVLIFERIREERDRGIVFRKALNAGYEKAFSTILDSNLTTLLTCIILGFMGSEEVKGFAITLGVGVATSMFTALVVTRLVFTALIDWGVLHDFSMRRILQKANWNWLSMRRGAMPVSLVLVLGMMGLFTVESITQPDIVYDIEFLGGTSVQVDLREGVAMNDEQVRRIVNSPEGSAGWLRNAADQLAAATVSPGEGPSEFILSSDRLTGEELADLVRGVAAGVLERNGVTASGRTARFLTRPGVITLEGFTQVRDEAVAAARRAADHLGKARVQSIGQLGPDRTARSYDVVTVETNRELVQRAIMTAFRDYLDIRQAIGFDVRTDETITRGPFFVIDSDAQYLSDVLGGDAPFDIRAFKGGVAFDIVLEASELPATTEELSGRLRGIRLLPEFDEYELRRTTVFPLGEAIARADGRTGFRRFAVLVADDNVLYDDDPSAWEERLARVELDVVHAALGRDQSLTRVTNFEPQLASQVQQEAFFAVFVALAGIVAYVWLRFGTPQFGLAACVALAHDVSITLGLIFLAGFKIDLAMMAAILTVIGYSLNDTIVVFDRIRENRGRAATLDARTINDSINQTLSRTLLTSGTTMLALLVMCFLGGEGLRGFAFTLLAGIVVGTYSSIFIAAPLLFLPRLLNLIVVLLGFGATMGAVMLITHEPAGRIILWGLTVAIFAFALYRMAQGRAPATARKPA